MRADTDIRQNGDLLIESSIDAMIAIDIDDVITAWNSAATNLFNLPHERAAGNSLVKILPSLQDDDDLQSAIRMAKEGKKSFLASSVNFRHRKHVEIHVIPLKKNETVVGVLLLIHDVSHRIAKELELQRLNEELQNRLRQLHLTSSELAQLTHIASHSIRYPIREIYTTVEGLLRTEASVISNHGRASFRRIQSSLNRMNLLLDDITTLTQIDIANRPVSKVDLSEVIRELKTQFAKKFQDTRTVLTIGNTCDIRAHRDQVLLLLQHIFSGVIKSATADPRLHLTCEKTNYIAKSNDSGKTGEYFLLSIMHNGTAFDNVDPNKTLKLSDNSDIQNYTGPAIAMVIAGRIMEVHSGFLKIEKAGNNDNRINCFFPATEN